MKKDVESSAESKRKSCMTTNQTKKLVFKRRFVKVHNLLFAEQFVDIDPIKLKSLIDKYINFSMIKSTIYRTLPILN